MGKYISLIKPPKKYLLFVFFFTLFSLISYLINYIFDKTIERSDHHQIRGNFLIYFFIEFLGFSTLLIPDIFTKKSISQLNKISDTQPINKLKYILMIVVIDLLMLIQLFATAFFICYIIERRHINIYDEYEGLIYFFSFIISRFYFKNSYYKHQYISFSIIIIVAICRILIRLNHYHFFNFNIKDIIIESFLTSLKLRKNI